MLSRRDLITTGVVGGLAPVVADGAVTPPAGLTEELQDASREGQREISRRIGDVYDVLRAEYQTSTLSYGIVAKLRTDMEQFLRANTKFPDFIEIGIGVFMEVYDWHIKYRQQLVVTRQGDGRYSMLFMFTTLILRPEQDRSYVGVPYDRV